MESLLTEPTSWVGLVGTIAMLLVGNVTRKYVIPFLSVGKRQKYAQYIATIADEVTDDLKNTYPDKEWLKHLDKAVDQLVNVCQVTPEIARRAINASIERTSTK